MEFKNILGNVPNISYALPPVLSDILESKKQFHKIYHDNRIIFYNNLIIYGEFIAYIDSISAKDNNFMYVSCELEKKSAVVFALFLGLNGYHALGWAAREGRALRLLLKTYKHANCY
jgi:hypothetical protein